MPTRTSEAGPYQFHLDQSFGRGSVEAVSWAPDGNSFALATSIQVDLYDAKTLDIVATLDTRQWNKTIAYSPDSQLVAVGDEEGTIQIWDLNARKLIHTLTPTDLQPGYTNGPVFAFSADGQTLVSAFNQSVYLWNLQTGKLIDFMVVVK